MKTKRIILVISMLLFFVLLQASAFSEIVMVSHTYRHVLIETYSGDMGRYEVYDNGVLIGYMENRVQPSWFEQERTYMVPEIR